jgi:hypothetical protein
VTTLSHGTAGPKPRTQFLKYEFVQNQLIIHMDQKTGFMTGEGDEELSLKNDLSGYNISFI